MRRLASAILLLALCPTLYAEAPIPSPDSVDVGFSPGGTALTVVEKAIGSAKSSILVACYELTSRDIAESLEKAAHRGVKVRIVADFKAAHDRYSQISVLRSTGIPVRLDKRYEIFHHKFLVIDGSTLETGSFNYTTAAIAHNAENAIVLWNSPGIADTYRKEWERLWNESSLPLQKAHTVGRTKKK